MSDTADPGSTPAPRGAKLPYLLGLVAGLAASGGGYYLASSGLLPFGGRVADAHQQAHAPAPDQPAVSFVALEPLLVSLGGAAPGQNLRFEGHLEVAPGDAAAVAAMMPRIMDVLNSYLRAVEAADIGEPAALIRLRAQMLRRIQVVTGEGLVRDLLIAKFLVS